MKQDICHTRQRIYDLDVIEKVNSAILPEIKLIVQNPRVGWKIGYFLKVEIFLIQKLGNISIILLVYDQKLRCKLITESFLVFELKYAGVIE